MYKFSVIIPVYNCAEYLEEAIQSVLSQSIGAENIQIILVNDGSTDNSLEICRQYESHDIVVVNQENKGVSAARNLGMKHAKGEIITFLDSDDKWDKKAFEQMYELYLEYPEVKLFTCKMLFFEARKGSHHHNYKFNKDKIVHIYRDIYYPQLFVNSAFFVADAIKDIEFMEGIRYGEDIKFIADFLFKHKEFMVMSKPVYYYRRRYSENSAIQVASTSQDAFFERYEFVYKYIFDRSKREYGYVLPYFQYLVTGDLQWYIKDQREIMGDRFDEFVSAYKELISEVDDDIINSIKNLSPFRKLYMLSLKHGKLKTITLGNKGKLFFGAHVGCNIRERRFVTIQTIHINENDIEISGKIEYPLLKDKFKILYSVNDVLDYLPVSESDKSVDGFEGPEYYNDYFEIKIPRLIVV